MFGYYKCNAGICAGTFCLLLLNKAEPKITKYVQHYNQAKWSHSILFRLNLQELSSYYSLN